VRADRKKFDAAGVTLADFTRLEDLEKFPFATKQDVHTNTPLGRSRQVATASGALYASCTSINEQAPLPAPHAAISTWRLS